MKMNKMFTGLIALVAGVALSAGSAFATKGYTIGDAAGMKLIPFYEAGGSLFTAIAIHNMSAREASTATVHGDVDTAQMALDNADQDALTGTEYAALEMTLADAKEAIYTENLFVNVMVHDAMGMAVMEDPVTLCLGENQSGHVLLTGPDVPSQVILDRGMVISMEMDDIPPYGYVTVTAGMKYTACDAPRHTALTAVDTGDDAVGNNMIAAWTILQDVGTGFFGTEIPTSTVSMATDGDDTDMVGMGLGCYGDGSEGDLGGADMAPGNMGEYSSGAPDYRCGLIPERHNNTRGADGMVTAGTATPPSMVTVRFDVIEGTENNIFVWLAEGEDTEDTAGSGARHVMATVTCEDGMMAQIPNEAPFADAGAMTSMATVRLPDKVNMIDPMGDEKVIETDVLVVGGGAAALRAAIGAGKQGVKVTVALKGKTGKVGASVSLDSPAVAWQCADGCSADTGDSPKVHFQEIVEVGLGMADPRLARIQANEIVDRTRELEGWGVEFVKDPTGKKKHFTAHSCFASHHRAHSVRDTGRGHAGDIVWAMIDQSKQYDIEVHQDVFITDLLVENGQCGGAMALGPDGQAMVYRTGAVMFGAGGARQIFPPVVFRGIDTTGDGYAMALRAGAELTNMEYIQYMVLPEGFNMMDIPGMYWSVFPKMRNRFGEEALSRYLPDGLTAEEAMRNRCMHMPFSMRDGSGWIDVAVAKEQNEGRNAPEGGLYLDFSECDLENYEPVIQHHFDEGKLKRKAIRPGKEARVVTTAHASNGGILINEQAQASLPGLFAAGEVCSGPPWRGPPGRGHGQHGYRIWRPRRQIRGQARQGNGSSSTKGKHFGAGPGTTEYPGRRKEGRRPVRQTPGNDGTRLSQCEKPRRL